MKYPSLPLMLTGLCPAVQLEGLQRQLEGLGTAPTAASDVDWTVLPIPLALQASRHF